MDGPFRGSPSRIPSGRGSAAAPPALPRELRCAPRSLREERYRGDYHRFGERGEIGRFCPVELFPLSSRFGRKAETGIHKLSPSQDEPSQSSLLRCLWIPDGATRLRDDKGGKGLTLTALSRPLPDGRGHPLPQACGKGGAVERVATRRSSKNQPRRALPGGACSEGEAGSIGAPGPRR